MSQFETLNVEIDGRIAWVTFDHPPINLLDMRFAAIERTTLSQPEVAFGILRSGSGSARLPHLVGFGKSDKFADENAYSYVMQVDHMTELVQKLNLSDMTFSGQDWGGLVALRTPIRYRQAESRSCCAVCLPPGMLRFVAQVILCRNMLDPSWHS